MPGQLPNEIKIDIKKHFLIKNNLLIQNKIFYLPGS